MGMAFKDDFKKGCEASGGDFVENASDDSFSCNIKSGGTIRCVGTSCTYSPTFKSDTGLVLSQTRPGIGELVTLSSGSSTGIVVDLTTAGVEEILARRSRPAR
jgi:hypothetical protein